MNRSTTCGSRFRSLPHPTGLKGTVSSPRSRRRRGSTASPSERTTTVVEREHVYGTGALRAVSLQARADDERSTVSGDGERAAELVTPPGVVALHIRALGPSIAAA